VSSLAHDAARRLRSNPGAVCAMFVAAGLVALALSELWPNAAGTVTSGGVVMFPPEASNAVAEA